MARPPADAPPSPVPGFRPAGARGPCCSRPHGRPAHPEDPRRRHRAAQHAPRRVAACAARARPRQPRPAAAPLRPRSRLLLPGRGPHSRPGSACDRSARTRLGHRGSPRVSDWLRLDHRAPCLPCLVHVNPPALGIGPRGPRHRPPRAVAPARRLRPRRPARGPPRRRPHVHVPAGLVLGPRRIPRRALPLRRRLVAPGPRDAPLCVFRLLPHGLTRLAVLGLLVGRDPRRRLLARLPHLDGGRCHRPADVLVPRHGPYGAASAPSRCARCWGPCRGHVLPCKTRQRGSESSGLCRQPRVALCPALPSPLGHLGEPHGGSLDCLGYVHVHFRRRTHLHSHEPDRRAVHPRVHHLPHLLFPRPLLPRPRQHRRRQRPDLHRRGRLRGRAAVPPPHLPPRPAPGRGPGAARPRVGGPRIREPPRDTVLGHGGGVRRAEDRRGDALHAGRGAVERAQGDGGVRDAGAVLRVGVSGVAKGLAPGLRLRSSPKPRKPATAAPSART